MNIHLVGNGTSSSYFDRTQCNKSDVVVGCNFSDSKISPDFVSIIDLATMKKIADDSTAVVHYPAVITDRCSDYKEKNERKISQRLKVLDVVQTRQIRKIDKNIPMNSAQHGLLYAIEKYTEANQVFIWGIDSFWTDNISSSTDRIIKKNKQVENPRISRIWRNYWHHIFQKYSDTHHFTIFALESVEIDEKNVSVFTLSLQIKC